MDNEEQARSKAPLTEKTDKNATGEVKTGGGAYIAGNVSAGGHFIGRDYIQIGMLKIPKIIASALVIAIVIGLVGLGFITFNTFTITGAITAPTPTATATVPTATPTNTSLPTATPLAFATGSPSETLILIATFHNTAATNVEAHTKIRRAIDAEITKANEHSMRVAVEPTELTADQQTQAAELGRQYNASIVIWGEDTGAQTIVNFLNLKEPYFNAANVTIAESERTQIANPRAYNQFIVNDLPSQLTFLTLFARGQSYSNKADYSRAITTIETALASLKDKGELEGMSDAYFSLGWLYQIHLPNNLNKALANYNKAIELDPNDAINYEGRGLLYIEQREMDKALKGVFAQRREKVQ